MRVQLALLFIYLMLNTEIYAQTQADVDSAQTILYIKKIPPSYSKNQNRWLQKKGFNRLSYNWGNRDINTNIKQAMGYRTISKVNLGITGFYILRGLLFSYANLINPTNKEAHKERNSYMIAGGFTIASGITINIAKSKITKARRLKVGLINSNH